MTKSTKNRITHCLLLALCIALFSLAGYFYLSMPVEQNKEDTWANSGFLKIGHHLTIQNADNALNLLDDKDVLSASGLYYAAWTMGEPSPYMNSDGENVDLYDVQLYLVLSEHKNAAEADTDMTKWADLSRENYQVLIEEDIVCNGQSYLLMTYECVSEDNPYHRGVSALGVHGSESMCFELTCVESCEEDLKTMLISFLNNCTYGG